MNRPIPETETMKISEVKSHLSSIVNEVYRHEKRVVIEKSGIPVAVVVSIDDLEQLAAFDNRQREAWDVLEAMRAPFRGVPPEEIEREAAKAIAEVRAARRAEREDAVKSA